MNLEMTERLEIGLSDRTSVASMSGFFRRGVINAVLNATGTTLSDNDRLTRALFGWKRVKFQISSF